MADITVDVTAVNALMARLDAIGATSSELSEEIADALAMYQLRQVKKLTPVGTSAQDAEAGHPHGYLRRGWRVEKVAPSGTEHRRYIANNVEYAAPVNYGHRQEVGRYVPAIKKRLKRGFVPGAHMLEKSEEQLRQHAGGVINRRVNKFFKDRMEGGNG